MLQMYFLCREKPLRLSLSYYADYQVLQCTGYLLVCSHKDNADYNIDFVGKTIEQ